MKFGFFAPWFERLVKNKMRNAAQAVAGIFFGIMLLVSVRAIPHPFNYVAGGLGVVLLAAAVLTFAYVMISDALRSPPGGEGRRRTPNGAANPPPLITGGAETLDAPDRPRIAHRSDKPQA